MWSGAWGREERYGPLLAGGVVTLVTLVLYATLACRTIPFGDGPELIAAADCLGVAHPPGYPLYTLLGWLVLRLPLAEPAFGMNLLSGLFGALACGAVAWLSRRLGGSVAGATGAALAFAISSTFAWVATVAEVYSLHVLLVALLLCAAAVIGDAREERARGRAVVAAGIVLGTGLAHHPTIVLALPAAACLALPAARRRVPPRHLVLAAAAAVAIPCLLYLTLMLRARLGPPSNWGRPVDLHGLLVHVRALSFRHLDLGWKGLLRGGSWAELGAPLIREFSPLVFPLALLGLAGWPRPALPARARVALGLLAAATGAFGLRYSTADVEVFYLPLFLALALAAGAGAGSLASSPRRPLRAAGATVALLLVAHTAFVNLPARDLREVSGAEDHARDILATLPAGSVLFIESMDAFGVLYLHQVRGERPDLTVYDRNGAIFRDLARDFPAPRRAGEPSRNYRLRLELAFLDREFSEREPRPVFFLGWPGYDAPPGFRIEPVGLLHRVRPDRDPREDVGRIWEGYHMDRVIAQALRVRDVVALAVAATYRVALGERAMFQGERGAAARFFQEAGHLAGRAVGVHSYIGTVYGRHGDLPRAITWFRHAVEVRPSYTKAWNNLAIACERSGDLEGARNALRRSLEVAPGQADIAAELRRLGPP
jgi:tetratricopeptide (TPR) repeat protein